MAGCKSNPLAAVGTQLAIFMRFLVQPLRLRELGLFLGKHLREPLAFPQVRCFGDEVAEMQHVRPGNKSIHCALQRIHKQQAY